VLVLHATDDRIIPFAQGEALALAAPDGKLVRFAGYGHQLQFTAPAQDAVIGWLAALHL
jgi:pimeloyl-ACP methyl ester carboxylesterase